MNNHDKNFNLIMTVEQLAEEMDDVNLHDEFHITIINLLPHKYFEDCHIKGSINVDVASLSDIVEDWDRTRAIVVYEEAEDTSLCENACKILSEMGFADVRMLEGGMKEWLDQGYATEGACKMACVR